MKVLTQLDIYKHNNEVQQAISELKGFLNNSGFETSLREKRDELILSVFYSETGDSVGNVILTSEDIKDMPSYKLCILSSLEILDYMNELDKQERMKNDIN